MPGLGQVRALVPLVRTVGVWGAGWETLGAPGWVWVVPPVHEALVQGHGRLWELVDRLVVSVLEVVAGSKGEEVGVGVRLPSSSSPGSPGVASEAAPGRHGVVSDLELGDYPLAFPSYAPVDPVSLVSFTHVLV